MSIKNFSKITAVYLLSVFGMLVVNNNNTRVSAMNLSNPSNLSSKPKVSSVSSKPNTTSENKISLVGNTTIIKEADENGSESSFEINNNNINNDNNVSMKENIKSVKNNMKSVKNNMKVEKKDLERSNLKELSEKEIVSVVGEEKYKFNINKNKSKEKESEKSVPPSQPMSTGKKVGIVAAIVAGAAALGTGIYALCQKVSRTSSSSRSNITPQINASTNKITNAN